MPNRTESPTLRFHHPRLDEDLLIYTGVDDISWGYNLNTANFPTYGGEVVQILSIYIDDLYLSGTVRTSKKLEAIYTYFAAYMSIASQGGQGTGSYDQRPMELTYYPRQWTFSIQPLSAPGFSYSKDQIAPEWHLQAHVKDETAGNYETLKQMTEITKEDLVFTQNFKLKGIISAASRDPSSNPFMTPLKKGKNNKFEGFSQAETEKNIKKLADYYNSLLPPYLEGDYSDLIENIGASGPVVPKQSNEEKAK